MERIYKKPVMKVERFVANEYVAACGDLNKVYKFKCDGKSGGFFSGGNVYLETNGIEGLQKSGMNPDTYRSQYSPCGETHEAPVADEFASGYLVNLTGTKTTPVIVWTNNNTNTHCTTNLNMETWETDKS